MRNDEGRNRGPRSQFVIHDVGFVTNPMPDSRFPKSRRLLKSGEFERAFKRRRSHSDGMLVVYGCENELPVARLGLVVSRKVGDAVTRNRWKRCLREAFRLAQDELPAGIDLVVLPRAGATPTAPRLRRSLCELASRLSRTLAASAAPRVSERPQP